MRDATVAAAAEAAPDATGFPPNPEVRFEMAEIPSAPPRFLEGWIQTFVGFLVCIVLPILFYAQAMPFAEGIKVAEQTIIATAAAYLIVVYCGSRLAAFPGTSFTEQAAFFAPIVAVCFAAIGIVLLAFRLEYSRVQFFGSGFLVFVWMVACVAGLPHWVVGHGLAIATVNLAIILVHLAIMASRGRSSRSR